MTTGDVITDILYDLFISIGAEELRDLLHKILTGEDVEQLAANGDLAAQQMRDSFADAGYDAGSFTTEQWNQLDASVQADFDPTADHIHSGLHDPGIPDASDLLA